MGCITGDFKTFFDDLMSIGATWDFLCATNYWVKNMMGYLGLQDATRKKLPITQVVGECTGDLVRSVKGVGLWVTVPKNEWDRVKVILELIVEQFCKANGRHRIDLKYLEQKVCFLLHLSMDSTFIAPFLKGIYLTINP